MQVNKWSVNPEMISTFSQLWSVLDPGSGSVSVEQLAWLMQRLPQPLGARTLTGAKVKMRSMVLIRDAAGRAPFRTTLYELLRAAVAVPLPHHVRVVQQHMWKMRQFFERNPIDANDMVRALWGTFHVDSLLLDEDDIVWGSDCDSDDGRPSCGGSSGPACSAGDDGSPRSGGAGTRPMERPGETAAREDSSNEEWAKAGLVAVARTFWHRMTGGRIHPEHSASTEGPHARGAQSSTATGLSSIADVRGRNTWSA